MTFDKLGFKSTFLQSMKKGPGTSGSVAGGTGPGQYDSWDEKRKRDKGGATPYIRKNVKYSGYVNGYERVMKLAGLAQLPGQVYRETMNILGSPINVAGGVAREAFVPYAKKNPEKINKLTAGPMRHLNDTIQDNPDLEQILRMSNPEQADQLISMLQSGDITPLLHSNPQRLAKDVGRLGILGGGTYAKSKLDEKYEDEGGVVSHGKNVLKEKLMPRSGQ